MRAQIAWSSLQRVHRRALEGVHCVISGCEHLLEGDKGLVLGVDIVLVDFISHQHQALLFAELDDVDLVLMGEHCACMQSQSCNLRTPKTPSKSSEHLAVTLSFIAL